MNIVKKLILKYQAKKHLQKRQEIIESFDKNEEKLFELLRKVLKNPTFIYKYDGELEVSDNIFSVLISESDKYNETCIWLKKPDHTIMQFFMNNTKSAIFKEEIEKNIKKISFKHNKYKTKGVEIELDECLNLENLKNHE